MINEPLQLEDAGEEQIGNIMKHLCFSDVHLLSVRLVTNVVHILQQPCANMP